MTSIHNPSCMVKGSVYGTDIQVPDTFWVVNQSTELVSLSYQDSNLE
jgi:hypothetical protein